MENYVNFEQAKALKRLGFDWCCHYRYGINKEIEPNIIYNRTEVDSDDLCVNVNGRNIGDISAPTLAQAAKWVREKYNIIILVNTYFKNYMEGDYSKAEFEYVIVNMNFNAARKGSSTDGKLFESFEKALSAGIDKALEFLK